MTNTAPIYFKDRGEEIGTYPMIAVWLVFMSALSLGVNSIYVNNYMTRPDVSFGQILTDGERTFMFVAFGFSLASLLLTIGLLTKRYFDPKQVPCTSKIKVTKDVFDEKNTKVGTTDIEVEPTYGEIKLKGTNLKGCNILKECYTVEESVKNEDLFRSQKLNEQTCRRRVYGTNGLLICNFIVSLMGLTTSSILWFDTTQNNMLAHKVESRVIPTTLPPPTTRRGQTLPPTTPPPPTTPSNLQRTRIDYRASSTVTYVICLIFAVLSGAIPVVMFTFAYAKSQCNPVAKIVEQKQVAAPKETKPESKKILIELV